jgi:hypothetical protein
MDVDRDDVHAGAKGAGRRLALRRGERRPGDSAGQESDAHRGDLPEAENDLPCARHATCPFLLRLAPPR